MTDIEVQKLYGRALAYFKRGRSLPAKLRAQLSVCNECESPKQEWYMMRNDLWKKVNPVRHGHLCLACLRKRMGRPLRGSDFVDQPTDGEDNLIHLS